MGTTSQPVFTITEGPGREYLWLALAHANELSDPYVEFTFKAKDYGDLEGPIIENKRRFILNSLGREDGSGHNWRIELVMVVHPGVNEPRNWSGYYNSRRRTGWLTSKK